MVDEKEVFINNISEYERYLSDIVGVNNLIVLSKAYGNKRIRIPKIKPYDNRIKELYIINYLDEYFKYNVSIDDICENNCLSKNEKKKLNAYVKYCEPLYIKSVSELIYAKDWFKSEAIQSLVELLGARIFVELWEALNGKYLKLRDYNIIITNKNKSHKKVQ